jgi:drug/metabolite transporter (DMT)-like permease
MTPKTISLIQVNLAVFIFGGTAMFAKGIDLPSRNVICLRGFVAAIAILGFLAIKRPRILPKSPAHWATFFLMGLFMCFHWLTYFTALKISTAAVAMLALQSYPVFSAVIEPLIYREKIRKWDLLMVLGVFIGVFIMTPEFSITNSVTQGILFGIISGLCFLGRNLITRKLIHEYSGSTLMFWQTLVTGLVLVPVVLLSEPVSYTPHNMGLIILLGAFFTALPQVMFSASLKYLRVTTTSVLATLLPLYGAILGFLVHDEVINAKIAIGGTVIMLCVLAEIFRHLPGKSPTETKSAG